MNSELDCDVARDFLDNLMGEYDFTLPAKAYCILRAALSTEAQGEQKPFPVGLEMPYELNHHTKQLVVMFAQALAEKLYKAEQKYGYSDGWRNDDWMDECRQKLMEHIAKGDPRDVAAYCAFLWHHGESTAPTPAAGWNDALEEAARIVENSALPDAYSEGCLPCIAEEIRALMEK